MPTKKKKSAYVWLWVLALAALSAAVSITHYKIGDSDYYWHCMYGQILVLATKCPQPIRSHGLPPKATYII